MATLYPAGLHGQAKERLARIGYDPKRLVLIHTAVSLGASLLVTLVGYLLSLKIAQTGGLRDMGLRTVLSTAQSVLELAVMVLLPFWEIGIAYAALHWTAGRSATPSDLMVGFRRWPNILGYQLLRFGLLVALMVGLLYPCTFLFMMTPWGTPLMEAYAPYVESAKTIDDIYAAMTPEMLEQMLPHMIPLLIFCGVLYAVVLVYASYRLRFADFALLEGRRGFGAMLRSFRVTRKHFWQIVKVDLYFWWFYLLQVLSVALCYGDGILKLLGVELPIQADLRSFLFYIAGILCQTLLFWQFGAQRITAYALAYETCAEERVMQNA